MENNKNLENNNKKEYKLKFSALIEESRQNSDDFNQINNVEYTTNLLLMSSQINITNKISCLTLLSYINYERRNAIYTYYLNKKIFKYLQIQKSIESFIYIRTLYRAAFFLKKEKNVFYAKKFIYETANLKKNSKIDQSSINMLNNINAEIDKELYDYFGLFVKKYKDIENPDNLTEEKYNKLLNLFQKLNNNTYIKTNNTTDDSYYYILNKKWFLKAFTFLSDYQKQRNVGLKDKYFLMAFEPSYCYLNYFDIKDENEKEKKYEYKPFPGSIDNYSIINWTDIWYDISNEDENYILKKDLKEGKDYFLLEKEDFDILQNFFGVTNIIKRKKNCGDFVEIKAFILQEKLFDEENNFLLRKRHLQVRKNYTIKNLKEKILKCIEYEIKRETIIKEKLIIRQKKEEERKNKKIYDDNNYTKEEEIDENIINKDMKIEIDINEYNIYFYLLEKKNKDILMEICIYLSNKLQKYESIDLEKISMESEENLIMNILSNYDLNKYILIIELQKKNSPQIISQISKINSLYNCSLCKKEIKSLELKYKCNICNYSIFCSEECAKKDLIHSKLDEIYINKYMYEQFDLNSFLKIKIEDLTIFKKESRKGLLGLMNLGNTCYINSTLQCLSNSLDLTKYFLLQYFKNDINTGNKLGSNGSVALRYYNLIKNMWCGNESRISPKNFVENIKKYKKQFEGYRQQDAQEFLSVLLDQLHEDLNRITEKPYIELLEKQANENDLIASKRWWDLHKKREDSIIVDLFNGQFKSETICQVCGKSSITYDPFMSLCVPLTNAKKHLMFKIFYETECKYLDFEYNENSTISDLRKSALDFIHQEKKYINYDLETIILDSNKNIEKIVSSNDKGQTKIKNFLINNEIVFFLKEYISNEKDYIKFFIYPIEDQKPERNYYYYNNDNNPKDVQLKYISYPLFFQMKKEAIVSELKSKLFERIKSQDFFVHEKYNELIKNKSKDRILKINIIHGKETKKGSFLSYIFFVDDNCKYCKQPNNEIYYCPIVNLGGSNKTLEENFNNFKKPIILVATSDCYNLSGEKQIYKGCPLFVTNVGYNLLKDYNTNSVKLKECLQSFVSNENFQDDDTWYCSNCKKLQKSKQKLQIYKPPNYLIILLKRYDLKKNYGNFYGEKNNTFVSYPINNFDIREYIEGPEKNNAIYDLYGIIEHFGTMSSGHYTAICKNNNKWISYNDSMIEINNDPISKNAYVLFYKMKNNE